MSEMARPRAYVLIDVDVHDAAQYAKYLPLGDIAAAANGAKFLARGGQVVPLEGGWQPRRVAVLEFADVDAARRWYDSPEYRKAREARAGAATFRAVIVEGIPPDWRQPVRPAAVK
ncbi:MAG: DUF1330 domain-containing protein [bacterium]